MDLKRVDTLNVDQLEIDDFILIDDVGVVQILKIEPLKNGYLIYYLDDYDEDGVAEVSDDAVFDWYILSDDDEE